MKYILPEGTPFVSSEKGKYRFFYPKTDQEQEEILKTTFGSWSYVLTKAKTILKNVPSTLRCQSNFGNLKPYLAEQTFAEEHLIPFRVIWVPEEISLEIKEDE